jgi:hypothetical protein
MFSSSKPIQLQSGKTETSFKKKVFPKNKIKNKNETPFVSLCLFVDGWAGVDVAKLFSTSPTAPRQSA